MKRREFMMATSTTAALSAVGVEASAEPKPRVVKTMAKPWEKGSSTVEVTKKLGRENGFDIEVVYTIPYEWTQFDDAMMRTFTLVSSRADHDFIRTSVSNTAEKPNVVVPDEVVLEQALDALKNGRDIGHILWLPNSYIFTHGELELDMNVDRVADAGNRLIVVPDDANPHFEKEEYWWMCTRESWPKLWSEVYDFFLIGCYLHGSKTELRLIGDGMTLSYKGSGVRLSCKNDPGHAVHLPAETFLY